MPKDYEYKLLLATASRRFAIPGSLEGIDTIVAHAKLSAENKIVGARRSSRTPWSARTRLTRRTRS